MYIGYSYVLTVTLNGIFQLLDKDPLVGVTRASMCVCASVRTGMHSCYSFSGGCCNAYVGAGLCLFSVHISNEF